MSCFFAVSNFKFLKSHQVRMKAEKQRMPRMTTRMNRNKSGFVNCCEELFSQEKYVVLNGKYLVNPSDGPLVTLPALLFPPKKKVPNCRKKSLKNISRKTKTNKAHNTCSIIRNFSLFYFLFFIISY